MTLPGAIQAIISIGSTIYAYKLYFKRWNNVIAPILLGLALCAFGAYIESTSPVAKDTVFDFVTFNAKHFHQGAATFGLGVGMLVGSLIAWIVTLFR